KTFERAGVCGDDRGGNLHHVRKRFAADVGIGLRGKLQRFQYAGGSGFAGRGGIGFRRPWRADGRLRSRPDATTVFVWKVVGNWRSAAGRDTVSFIRDYLR